MKLILAHRPGVAPCTVRELSGGEREGLTAHFIEGVAGASNAAILERCWRQRWWVGCDCRPTHEQPPMLFVRRTLSSGYVLTRMPDRPPHLNSCAFFRSPALAAAADGASVQSSALGHLLFRWLGGARLNILYPYAADDLVHSQYDGLREAARNLQIAPGRRLYEFSRTHADGLPELEKRIVRTPSGGGVYLAVTRALDEGCLREALVVRQGNQADWIQRPLPAVEMLPGTSSDRGPFILLFQFAREGASACVSVTQVFAHPVYSRGQLVPVEGAHERSALRTLLELQRELLLSHSGLITIRKTLPDTSVYERGITFHVQRLGPNGRPVQTLDVVCLEETCADPVPLALGCDVYYHGATADDAAQARADLALQGVLKQHLMTGMGARPRVGHAPPVRSTLHSTAL